MHALAIHFIYVKRNTKPIGSGLAPDCRPPQRGGPVPSSFGRSWRDMVPKKESSLLGTAWAEVMGKKGPQRWDTGPHKRWGKSEASSEPMGFVFLLA
ncbi:hypothetical protein KSZ_36920 [Dictyobacter formicarum]|uniref:Uncharacterized protein n=1 Tax=Dictyobacter formicarum TaxID=2778368 RepID=A0ABQ3VJ42_9CHLR|nr:hypothetical protein KSZ_36920 [Dictyobacter formicarum]